MLQPSMQPSPEQRVGAILDGRYRLERLLGAGAMGAVYTAQASNGSRFAIKLLLDPGVAGSALNRALLGRFVREGKLTTQLRAPNVTEVYEFGVDAPTSTPFIVMELLDGFDVDGLIERVGPVHPAIAVRIAIGAARGLGVAHAAGIIHRDVKPANLFLHRTRGPQPSPADAITVKVADFGVAKALFAADGEAMTATGSMLGSPLYMSPEQIKNAKYVDHRSDVWSLGMALYKMLAGRAALENCQSIAELMVSLSSQKIPWLQDAAPWIDPALATIVHGTLIGELGARCPNVSVLIEALRPFAAGSESITAGDLVGTPDELRRHVAPRGAPIRDWTDSPVTSPPDGASDPANAEVNALVGSTLGGKYRLERLLGHGGMGAVYEAVTASGERVAVKVVLEGERRRPEFLRRFVREAKTTTAIESPNVVRVLEVDGDASRGVPYIVMELLQGTDLDRLVRERGALEPGVVSRLFLDACRGLSAAHARGVVHRDIKPANIFLHRAPDGTVSAKICDFGIAKTLQNDVEGPGMVSTELTRTGGMIGSPPYMSPEQAKSSKSVGRATDVWSLGVALYEALSGKRPFQCDSVGELMVAIITQPVVPLQDVAPWIEPTLADIVHKALQKDPAQRHASMEAFAQALYPHAEPKDAPLTTTSLVPVHDSRRRSIAQRSTGVGATITSAAAAADVTGSTSSRGARSKMPTFIGVGVVVSAIVAGGVFLFKQGPSAGASTSAANPTSTGTETDDIATNSPTKKAIAPLPLPTTTDSLLHVRVKISPATATVTVNGKSAAVVDGAVTLDGEPGDSFEVAARIGDRELKKQIFLRKDGKPSIDSVDVPTIGGVKPLATKLDAGPPGTAKEDPNKPLVVSPPPPTTKTTSSGPVGESTF